MPLILTGVVLALALSASVARAEPFTFVAIGDMPYRLPDDYTRFERLIAGINGLRPAFTIHVGDIKGGSTPCTDEILQRSKDYFSQFEQPLIYTPGDNEWTDCYRERAGKFDPIERLSRIRAMYFEKPESLGKATIKVERQADLMPEHKALVENQRWAHEGVLFATIHAVGSNNGFERTLASVQEFLVRDAANVAWIKATFAKAAADNAPAIVIAFQADPNWQKKLTDRGGEDGYANMLKALAAGAEAYRKPVLLVQGDSHVLIIDQPLPDSAGRRPLLNVTRLQVMGQTQVHGVRVMVDPADPAVFGFMPLVIKENLEPPQAG